MTGWSLTSVPSALDAPMTWPPLTPPPARATLKTLGKWSRPALGLILGVRPNSPIQTTSVLLEHAPLLQVGDQGGEPRVDLVGQLADLLVVLLVGVPAVGADLDEGDAGLDQPAGQQAALAERGPAVGVAERLGLLIEVERLHVGREDHLGGLAVKRRWSRTRSAPPVRSKPAPSSRSSRPSRRRNRSAATLGWVFSGGLLRVLDHERLERRAQEARADRRRRRCSRCAAGRTGSRPARSTMRAADVRVLDRRRRHIAGVKLVGRPLMVALLVGHRPHQGDVFHDLGRLVPALGDRDARDGRRDRLGLAAVLGAGLGVEGLELAGAAGHPEQDAGHLPLAQLGGLEGHPVGEADGYRAPSRPGPPSPGRSSGGSAGGRSRPSPFIATWTVSFSSAMDLPSVRDRADRRSLTESNRRRQRRVRNSVVLIRLQ